MDLREQQLQRLNGPVQGEAGWRGGGERGAGPAQTPGGLGPAGARFSLKLSGLESRGRAGGRALGTQPAESATAGQEHTCHHLPGPLRDGTQEPLPR